jgi:hypothetical protein
MSEFPAFICQFLTILRMGANHLLQFMMINSNFAIRQSANASFVRPCQRPDRQDTADNTTQTLMAGT